MTLNISLNFHTQGFWKFTMHFRTNGPQKANIFPYLGMITQSQLTIMDFNKRTELEHATKKAGEKRYACFSKITNS